MCCHAGDWSVEQQCPLHAVQGGDQIEESGAHVVESFGCTAPGRCRRRRRPARTCQRRNAQSGCPGLERLVKRETEKAADVSIILSVSLLFVFFCPVAFDICHFNWPVLILSLLPFLFLWSAASTEWRHLAITCYVCVALLNFSTGERNREEKKRLRRLSVQRFTLLTHLPSSFEQPSAIQMTRTGTKCCSLSFSLVRSRTEWFVFEEGEKLEGEAAR